MERTPIAAVVSVAVPNRGGNDQATKHIAVVRIPFIGDVHFQEMPSTGRRKQLHALEWLAPENHRPGGVVVVVVEFQCRGPAAGTMNTPGVGDTVRTAETEMTLFPLIVAAEPLIDVVVVVTPIGQRAKRNIAFVGKHIGSAAVIRSDGRFLTVQIGGIVNIDKHVLDADMAGIVCPERISGEPGFQLVDIRNRIVAGHGALQFRIGQTRVVDVQRSPTRIIDRNTGYNRNFGENSAIIPIEFKIKRNIVAPGIGGIGIADRGSDGVFLVLAEVDRDVADIFFDSRNIIGAVTVVQSDRRSGAAPAAGNIDRNVRYREIPQIGEINQVVLKIEICRTHFTQAPVRHIDGNVVNPRIEIPGNPEQTRNVFIRPVENKLL